jgi:hypothetical protein
MIFPRPMGLAIFCNSLTDTPRAILQRYYDYRCEGEAAKAPGRSCRLKTTEIHHGGSSLRACLNHPLTGRVSPTVLVLLPAVDICCATQGIQCRFHRRSCGTSEGWAQPRGGLSRGNLCTMKQGTFCCMNSNTPASFMLFTHTPIRLSLATGRVASRKSCTSIRGCSRCIFTIATQASISCKPLWKATLRSTASSYLRTPSSDWKRALVQ